jgi:AcrR family transcriptional regulator
MRKGALTKSSVVDRALALSTQIGLEGLSIGRLASDLNLSKSGLFAHFQSKEALEVAVVERAAERFAEVVVRPAIAEPSGEPRLRALFERWRRWPKLAGFPGGCFFVTAAAELDDREGPVRDAFAGQMRELQRTIERMASDAKRAGHFREDLDPALFAFELLGVVLSLHQAARLVRDPRASALATASFDALLARSKAPSTL